MNLSHLLDSLDGLKTLVFKLLPTEVTDLVAAVPMTTDGPWTEDQKAVYQKNIGIPAERSYWKPGGFNNVPLSKSEEREKWIDAVAKIPHRYLFLDPDAGFYRRHTRDSRRILVPDELKRILTNRDVLIIYRHQYWPKTNHQDARVYPYVSDGLHILREACLTACAYQSPAASLFFVSGVPDKIAPFADGLRRELRGEHTRRLVE
jgi:hypothetical protein